MGNLRRWPIIRELGEEQGNFFNKGWCVTRFDNLLFLNFPRVNTVWDFFYLCPLLCTLFSCQIRVQRLYTSITAIRLEDVRHVPRERETDGSKSWCEFEKKLWSSSACLLPSVCTCYGAHSVFYPPPSKKGFRASFHFAFLPEYIKNAVFMTLPPRCPTPLFGKHDCAVWWKPSSRR